MTEKNEALRLADEWLRKKQSEASRRNSAYDYWGMDNTPEKVDPLGAKMAAELRRLSAVEAQRDALLEACKAYDQWADKTLCYDRELRPIRAQIRAAIDAVEGEKT